MRQEIETMNPYIPILIMFGIAMAVAGIFLLLSHVLGPKKPTPSKLSVYECGLEPVSDARERFSVKFYLVAILFIIFDIEVVFMYPWAINFKDAIAEGNGLYMLIIMGIFFTVLTIGLLYEWRKGALVWSEKKHIAKKS